MANLPGPMSSGNTEQLKSDAEELLANVGTLDELDQIESQLVGRRSELAELRRTLGDRPVEERRSLGAKINEAQRRVEELVAARRHQLEEEAEDRLLAADRVDITLPGVELRRGTHHLITQSMAEICEIFSAIGYQVVTGPEVETVHYNFDALNHVPHHPACLPSDTLYLEPWDGRSSTGADALLLRTHTSPMQARIMERQRPPVYVVVPGRTYPTRSMGRHPRSGLPSGRGSGRGQRHHIRRPQGDTGALRQGDVRAECQDEVQPRLLPFHRAIGADGGGLA